MRETRRSHNGNDILTELLARRAVLVPDDPCAPLALDIPYHAIAASRRAGSAAFYLVLVLPQFVTVFLVVLNPTLPTVAALLGAETGATIAWVHFLAFDLFVGRWAYLDSLERSISAWVMAPVLFFTLMLGPIGFLLYLGLRDVLRRNR